MRWKLPRAETRTRTRPGSGAAVGWEEDTLLRARYVTCKYEYFKKKVIGV